MNVVDSSGFLEFFAGTAAGERFAPAITRTADLIVPVLTIYEVFKKVSREHSSRVALEYVSAMRSGRVIAIDLELSLDAARLGNLHGLALADSLIYATAQVHSAELWTQDAHFKGLPGVRYFPKS